jgi:hypothetical protein
MFCKNCGKKLNQEAKFCNACGTAIISDVSNKATTKSPKFNFWKTYTYITAGIVVLLTIIFGFAGSYEEGFFEPFIGIVILSGLLGILGAFIVKWLKRGFAYENESENLSDEEVSKYKGLGGWLILVIIGLFLALIFQVYGVVFSINLFTGGMVEFLSNPASEIYIPGYAGALKFEIVLEILFVIYAAYLISLFFKKSRKFPKYYVTFLIVSVVYIVLDYLIVSSLNVSSSEMKKVIDEILSKQATEIGRTVISAIIWGLYITKSKRVRATFVED